MSDFYYPKIDEASIKNFEIVLQLAKEHNAYFLESPYSGEFEETVKRFNKSMELAVKSQEEAKKEELPEEGAVEGEARWQYLYRETHTLYKNLKSAKVSAGDTAEQMSYFRTATSLMEKLISMQERALGLKEIHEFHMAVLEVMEGVLSPTQRTEVMDKLKQLTGSGS